MCFAQAAFTQEIFRVTSVNFDTSNSMIFLSSPDNTNGAILNNVKLIKLLNPKRVYFDINSAVLSTAQQNWYLNSGGIKQVKVNQFSTNPNKIRVVIYLEEDFDTSRINFLKINNNIVIRLKNGTYGICQNSYFQNTYRDEKSSSSDFYENLSISSQDFDKLNPKDQTMANNGQNDSALNQIQQAFSLPEKSVSNVKPVQTKTEEGIKRELKLKSKYYLSNVSPKPNGFLLNGFGTLTIEKPMYLANPARVVFDIPNTIINPDMQNKEFKIGTQDTAKISQFESNKARLVITSNQLEKYFPIFSSDGQSVIFSNTENIDPDSLFNKVNDALSYQVRTLKPGTEEFTITFNSPVVHSIRRDNSKLTVNFLNTLRYNDITFRNAIQNTGLKEMKIDLLPTVGLKLTLPLEKGNTVNCYMGADGKIIKISVSGVQTKSAECDSSKIICLPKFNGKKSIVLDPGHGGSDYGAIRCGINEKDINLDVAKRVESILINKGIEVAMTRTNDETVSLEARTTFTENKKPGIFVSIHVNSSVKPEICGIETHYYHPESLDLAQTVHSSLISSIKTTDRGLFKSRFYVINHTTVPAILVEMGFISNDTERSELVSEGRKQQTARAIAEGIIRYLNKK